MTSVTCMFVFLIGRLTIPLSSTNESSILILSLHVFIFIKTMIVLFVRVIFLKKPIKYVNDIFLFRKLDVLNNINTNLKPNL